MAFEYSLIRLAQWYSSENKFASFEQFNERNDFGIEKSLLFPFFICTANGDREILFNQFCNKIQATEFGLVDKEIKEHIESLNYFKVGLFSAHFDLANQLSLNGDKNSILALINYEITDNQNDLFSNVITAIDTSIECIRTEILYPEFVTLGWEAIKYQSQEHNSWQIFSDQQILQAQPGEIIPSDFLINEKSPFASEDNKRMFA